MKQCVREEQLSLGWVRFGGLLGHLWALFYCTGRLPLQRKPVDEQRTLDLESISRLDARNFPYVGNTTLVASNLQ